MDINFEDIKRVKQITGASLNDCKDALLASNGNINLAISSLFVNDNKITLEKIQYVCHKTGSDFKESKQILIETDGNVFRAIDLIEARNKHNSTYANSTFREKVSFRIQNEKTGTRRLNIVVVGRSGVGKSSFLNYAAGKKVFETGIGEPVTQTYFQEIDVEEPFKNVNYCLFDTKGLEAGNTTEWKNAIYSEIDKRDASDNIYDWFHTLIFCIDASAKRIQPFEVQAIRDLSKKGSVLVLLTKKDLVEPPILEALKQQIISDIGTNVQVLSVCSVSMRTRKGESHANGLEDVLRVSFLGLWEKASKVLPNRVIKPITQIDLNMRMGDNISGLLAYYTLKIPFYPDSNKSLSMFPPYLVPKLLVPEHEQETAEKYLYNLDSVKKVQSEYDFYNKIERKTGIVYHRSNNDLILIIKGDCFDYLNIPDILSHSGLDSAYYRNAVHLYLHFIYLILQTLKERLRYHNIPNIIKEHKSIIDEILKFYKDITGNNLRHIDDSKTKEACQKLEDTKYYYDFWNDFIDRKSVVDKALNEVDSCFFSSGSERRQAEHDYIAFRDFVNDFLLELKDRLDSFVQSYSAELHAYGEYCIREDELVINDNNKQVDLKLLRDLIRSSLSDGVMTPKEYKIIRSVAENQGVTDMSILDDIIREVKKEIRK